MKVCLRFCSLLLTFLFVSAVGGVAQVSVMRNYFPAPLEDTTYQKGLFGKLAFSAEGSHGFGSAEGEQAWNMKLAARFYGRVNLYTYYVDGRRPIENIDQSLDYVRASALVGMRLNYSLGKNVFIFNRSWYNPVYFIEDDPWKSNSRI